MSVCVCDSGMLTAFTLKQIESQRAGAQKASITAGDSTSSISLVFDFSKESTLEWRLLTVLLELAMKKKKKLIQNHTSSKRLGQHTSPVSRLLTCPNDPEQISRGEQFH